MAIERNTQKTTEGLLRRVAVVTEAAATGFSATLASATNEIRALVNDMVTERNVFYGAR